MLGGSINPLKSTAINGPAVLTAGTVNVRSGASLFFNGPVEKGSQLVESSSGTISYADTGIPLYYRVSKYGV